MNSQVRLILFMVLLLPLFISGCTSELTPWQQLVTRNATATAGVVSTDCSNHGSVTYRFNINGRDYTNVSHWLDQPCDEIKHGDSVLVYYDPVNPSTNTTMRPSVALCHYQVEAATPFLFAGFFAVAIGLGYYRKKR
jgi:hypothetical protein